MGRAFGPENLKGGNLRGEFVATASEDGFSLRPKAPLTLTGVSVAQAGQPMLRAVDVSLNASVDYSAPWLAGIDCLRSRFGSGAATLLTLEAKAGQLAGADQPKKATGKILRPDSAGLACATCRGRRVAAHAWRRHG